MKLTTLLRVMVLPAPFVLAAAATGGACSSSVPPGVPGGAQSVMAAFGSCDSDTGYIVVDAVACLGLTCPTDYYALCNGLTFSACACTVPPGDTLIADPVDVPIGDTSGADAGLGSADAAVADGADAGIVDGGADASP
jgi:hypothetical protein